MEMAGNIGMDDCFDMFYGEELSDFANLLEMKPGKFTS